MHRKLRSVVQVATVFAAVGVPSCSRMSSLVRAEDALLDGDEEKAERLFRQALKREKDAKQAAFQLEALLMKRADGVDKGDAKAAAVVYGQILDINPRSQQARLGLARMMMRVDDLDGALSILGDADGCTGCKNLMAVVYERRAKQRIKKRELEAAAADFDAALKLRKDPLLWLAKTELYTKGGYGQAAAAVEALQRAADMLEPGNPSHVEKFVLTRREVAIATAGAGEPEAVEKAIAIPSPVQHVEDRNRLWEDFELKLTVASTQIGSGRLEDGMRRGAEVFAAARQARDKDLMSWVKPRMLDLFVQRGAFQIAAGDSSAVKGIEAGLRIDRNHELLRLQRVVAESIRSAKRARKLLSTIDRDSREGRRVQAILLTQRARNMLDIGQLTAAQVAVERAEEAAPGLFEVRLAAAEVASATRLDGLTKTAAEDFRRIGGFRYPEGRINRYGEALAELSWIQKHFDAKAARDPLRGPQFATRLETLDQHIRAFYPYDVGFHADPTAILILRSASGPIKVEVDPQRQRKKRIEVPGDREATLTFEGSGFVRLATAHKEMGLFVESYAKITAEI